MSRSLCITGMHRSGTSLTASWLERCGLAIDDGEVWGPEEGNVRGHFEDKAFVDLHSSAIIDRHPRSRGWKAFPGDFLRFDEQGLSRARQLAEQRAGKFDLWGWKDPRSVLFLQQWKALLPELACLIIWRPWTGVAGSLIRRSRKSPHRHIKVSALGAARLYNCYGELVCRYKLQHPDDTLLLPLEMIIGDDGRALGLINEKFGLHLEHRPIREQFDAALMHREQEPVSVKLMGKLFGVGETEARVEQLMDAKPETG